MWVCAKLGCIWSHTSNLRTVHQFMFNMAAPLLSACPHNMFFTWLFVASFYSSSYLQIGWSDDCRLWSILKASTMIFSGESQRLWYLFLFQNFPSTHSHSSLTYYNCSNQTSLKVYHGVRSSSYCVYCLLNSSKLVLFKKTYISSLNQVSYPSGHNILKFYYLLNQK